MNPIAYNTATSSAVSDSLNFIIGTLTNHAGMILTIAGAMLVFGFLSNKFSLR